MPAKLVALTVLILLGLTLSPLVPVDNRWPGSASAQSAKSWLYLNAFQSRKLIAIDPTTGRIEDSIDVDDAVGSLGAAVTSDGKTIITVDGSQKSRLRMFNAATLELIAEHAFDHRVLSRGSGPTIHLTADDRWLLVKTYDDAAAAKGVRVFDVEKRRFSPIGLRNRRCDDPSFASARDGRLIAACPGIFQELQPIPPNVQGLWFSGTIIKSPIESPADIALAGDGSALYAVGYPGAGGYADASGSPAARPPWLLSHWTPGQLEASALDLRVALGIQGYVPLPWSRAVHALGLSPDGKALAFVVGPHVWLLDSATLQVVGHWLEPSPVDRPAFSRDGKEILAIRHIGGGRDELIRISTVTRDVTRVPLDHLAMYFHTGVATFIVAPAL
jgi:hypothetical protein